MVAVSTWLEIAIVLPIYTSRSIAGFGAATVWRVRHGGRQNPYIMSRAAELSTSPSDDQKPIVWTIAGSDSGGGAGIQADLHAMHSLDTHACSVITAMTAQNSHEVRHVEYASVEMISATLAALEDDLPPAAIKLGMMGTGAVISTIGKFLEKYEGNVVCDPVMVSTSGSRLLAEGAEEHLREQIFSRSTILTPNLQEAELLLKYRLTTPAEVVAGATELVNSSGAGGVLIKGGHAERPSSRDGNASPAANGVPSAFGEFCQDYWTNGTPEGSFWLSTPRIDTENTHGTGCTLSSAIAACLAHGFEPADAVVIAKAYVTQGLRVSRRLGQGPGPVAQTTWPALPACFPWATAEAEEGCRRTAGPFPACHRDWGLYPIVETADWVEKLASRGVRDIQLRIKGAPEDELDAEIAAAAQTCREHDARLWVNDHWRPAISHKAYGVHLGQEDLLADGHEALESICSGGLRLGISTHSYVELARAVAARPSCISLGPVFETSSKNVSFSPRGSALVKTWRSLVDVPLVAIGGIDLNTASEVVEAGADGIAVISAITKAQDLDEAIRRWQAVFEASR